MTRMLLAVVALAVVGYLAYRQMYGSMRGNPAEAPPAERLQNVKDAAKRIEVQQQEHVDDVLDKTGEAAAH